MRGYGVKRTQKAFTLVELVVTLIIVGLLAAVAVPRFFDLQPFAARGFSDEVVAALRYAHKYAIATGCSVQVTIIPNQYQLLRPAAVGNCNGGPFGPLVLNPAGGNFTGTAPTGVALGGPPAIVFNALGQVPIAIPGFIVVTVNATQIRVYGETGFVEEL